METFRLTDNFEMTVGPEPKREWLLEHGFNAVVNVGDTPSLSFDQTPGLPNYWFPVQEMGVWSFEILHAAKRTLDHLLAQSASGPIKLYLHCHNGVNRSVAMSQIWLESAGHPGSEHGRKVVARNLILGHLPEATRQFLEEMNAHRTFSCMGIAQAIGIYKGLLPPDYQARRKTCTAELIATV